MEIGAVTVQQPLQLVEYDAALLGQVSLGQDYAGVIERALAAGEDHLAAPDRLAERGRQPGAVHNPGGAAGQPLAVLPAHGDAFDLEHEPVETVRFDGYQRDRRARSAGLAQMRRDDIEHPVFAAVMLRHIKCGELHQVARIRAQSLEGCCSRLPGQVTVALASISACPPIKISSPQARP
jgi:hypothetical protein